MPQGVANVMTDVFRDFSIKLKMNEAFYSFFNMGRTEKNFGEDNHFSVFTQFV